MLEMGRARRAYLINHHNVPTGLPDLTPLCVACLQILTLLGRFDHQDQSAVPALAPAPAPQHHSTTAPQHHSTSPSPTSSPSPSPSPTPSPTPNPTSNQVSIDLCSQVDAEKAVRRERLAGRLGAKPGKGRVIHPAGRYRGGHGGQGPRNSGSCVEEFRPHGGSI